MGVVTGTFQYVTGSPVANGTYTWKLSSDAVASVCFVPVIINGLLDVNGSLTSTFVFNDVLGTAAGTTTTYQLTVADAHSSRVWNENYYLTGTAANINTVLPGSGSAGTIFFPITGTGGGIDSVQTVTATGAIGFGSASNTFIKITAGAGYTLTAVSAVGVAGQRMRVMQVDTSAAGVAIVGTSAQTFNGGPNITLTNQWQCYTLESDNANWFIVAAAG